MRPQFRSQRRRIGASGEPHISQAGAALDQDVERGVDLSVVLGEFEALERLQLADERRDGAEAAAGEAEGSQRFHLPELCRERLVLGRYP